MNVQKKIEKLRNFDLTKHYFSSSTKIEKLFCLRLYRFGYEHISEKEAQKFQFWRLIGYAITCLDSFFAHSIIFRLCASVHDAVGSVKSTTHKGPGDCYNAHIFLDCSDCIDFLFFKNFCFNSICFVRFLVI